MISPTPRLFLLYHELRPAGSKYSYVVDTKQFEQQADLFLHLRSTSPAIPEITFDDGHISNVEHALPILQSRALQAWFFITVGWIGQKPGYMGWNELRTLHQAGQRIGAHGWSHTLLTHCNATQLHHELSDARLTLEDKLGTSITTLSLPGGRYNRRVLDACRQAGYTQVFTSIPKPEPDPSAFTLGRLNIRGNMSTEWIANLFQPGNNLLTGLERQYKIKATAKTLLGDRIYEKLWSILNRQETDNDSGEPAAREDSAHHQ